AMRVQGLHPWGGAGSVLSTEGHLDRVRRRADPPRPPARLSHRDRAGPLGGRSWVAHATARRPRPARRLGPLPHSAAASVRPEAAVTAGLRVLLFRAIYAVALGGAVAWMVLVLEAAAAAGTLGYDYRA